MKTFTILALLLAAVSATPVEVVERDPDPLEKRDTEIVYLANCISAVSCCTPDVHYSQIIVSGGNPQQSGYGFLFGNPVLSP